MFYPDCVDVFNVSQSDGITYYLIDKQIHEKCEVENRCSVNKFLNDTDCRNLTKRQTLWNTGSHIVDYLENKKKFTFPNTSNGRYVVATNFQLANGGGARGGVGIFNNEGNFQCVGLSTVCQRAHSHIFASRSSSIIFA